MSRAVLIVLSLLPALTRAADPATPWTVRGHVPPDQFVIQSHRGAGELAPENTLATFELAWQLGTYPEADVRTTRDGVTVTFHDANFARVVKDADEALRNKGVGDLTWDELSKLDVGSWRGEKFKGARVATVAEVFAQMTGRPERRLYLDIKTVDLAKLADEVRKHKVAGQVILASTKYDLIRKWKALVPESGTLLWMGGSEAELTKRFEELRKTKFADVTQLQVHVRPRKDAALDQPDPFTPSDAFLTATGRELRERGVLFQVLPWGVKDPKAYARLLDLGVMSFATDYPDVTTAAVRAYYGAPATTPAR
ncbi:MAG TPA: glycerophosphodiester phosphodiesterase family protein [Tepidisphaeraceae bacterium]|nr:glycerophosphodiester phosphodiesterase family protein [Tepidisphaeraceae bacterium]